MIRENESKAVDSGRRHLWHRLILSFLALLIALLAELFSEKSSLSLKGVGKRKKEVEIALRRRNEK